MSDNLIQYHPRCSPLAINTMSKIYKLLHSLNRDKF